MKKKILAVLLLSSLLMTGCSKLERIIDIIFEKETTEIGTETEPFVPVLPGEPEKPQNADIFSEATRQEIHNMKAIISEEADCILGTAFLGTCEGGYDEVMEYIRTVGGDISYSYPWLVEMPAENFLQNEGMELYAVMPGEDWGMTIYTYGMDPNNDWLPGQGEKLYEGGGPVLLQGNISDIVPGFQVILEKDGDTYEYFPCLSLENGKLQQQQYLYDFTPYDLLPMIPDAGNTMLSDNEAFAGYWESHYVDANGDEVLMFLTMAQDGRVSYSYGYANSEIAETFGGSWGIADVYFALELTGGTYDMEEGYITEPYSFESQYSYEWIELGSSFTLHLKEGTALLYGSDEFDLTFYCAGALEESTFDPMSILKPREMDPGICVGEWYATGEHVDGYELSMHLTLNADGTASYIYGYGNSEIYEWFEGTWTADKEGKLVLDLYGGPENVDDDSGDYDFDAVFSWYNYGTALGLAHEEGNPLLAGCENWYFEFMPFDYISYDGQWVAYDDSGIYELYLYSNGEASYIVTADDAVFCRYEGWWKVDDEMHLYLAMKRAQGTGDALLQGEYNLNWMEFPHYLDIQLMQDSPALTADMAADGSVIFDWIDPYAVG